MKRLVVCLPLLALAWSVLAVTLAHAYVMPPAQVLEFTVKALGSAQGLSIVEKVAVHPQPAEEEGAASAQSGQESPPAPAPLEFEGVVSYKFPEYFREEVATPNGSNILVASPFGVAKVSENRLIADSEDRYDVYKDLLLHRDPGMLLDRLAAHGVQTDVYSLGFWEGHTAFVIGAQYPDLSQPQVWIDKETFLPLRYIVTRQYSGPAGEGLEVRYMDWQGLLTQKDKKPKQRYPGRIVFLQGKTVLLEKIMVSYAMNPSFSPDQFNASLLKNAYEPSPLLREEHSLTHELDEVKEAMEGFRNVVR